MDSKLIYNHLEWVKNLESSYKYVEQKSESVEFDAFFEVAGEIGGGALGLAIGGWAASGALAAIFHTVGAKIDKKLGL